VGFVRVRLAPKAWSLLLVIVGAFVVAVGVGLVYPPAGVICAGAALVGVGLFLIDIPPPRRDAGR